MNKEQKREQDRIYSKLYYSKNKKAKKEYQEANKDHIRKKSKEHYAMNKGYISERMKVYGQRPEVKRRIKEYQRRPEVKRRNKEHRQRPEEKRRKKKYYNTNKDYIRQRTKEYQDANKDYIRQRTKEYLQRPETKIKRRAYFQRPEVKRRMKECVNKYREQINLCFRTNYHQNIGFKLSRLISRGISLSLNNSLIKKNGRRWEFLVGYDSSMLKSHLEKQFTPFMNWDNVGSYWELDHKIPVSWFSFDSPDDKEFKECWGLNNLQPLKKSKNQRKNNHYAHIILNGIDTIITKKEWLNTR